MIKVLFKKKREKILFFEIKGHSNLSAYGTDIVCAAVSSVSIMTLNGILEYLKYDINYEVNEGYILVDISDIEDNRIDTLINSMYLYLEELAKQYPKNLKLKVMEV
ncbi:ribosomal-processing cysteine protease Prp [Oceanivirga salmonicida]|uniref:ribosomal-processing cysteine protease Prp n=1 Tax=Oceanivirga salmonicida TaxID=1769291 RepID=UPI00082B7D4A|nr:ribosomal-processing cysteine protease Prp [Oceanivirga salmonicida]